MDLVLFYFVGFLLLLFGVWGFFFFGGGVHFVVVVVFPCRYDLACVD